MGLLAIFLPPILVYLEMVGECLGMMGLFMHSLPVTAPCLLAWDNSFGDVPSHHIATLIISIGFSIPLLPVGDVE